MLPNFLKDRFRTKESGTQYRSLWQVFHLDPFLLVGLLLLLLFGFFILYSASNQQASMIIQEILHIGFAALIMILLAQVPPEIYERFSLALFSIGSLLLLIVLVVGKIKKGAQRWLTIGFIHIQPSELMKIAIPMMLAWYFAHRVLPPKMKDIFICALLIMIPVILTAKEPDLGTAIILALGGLSVLFLSGLSAMLIGSSFLVIAILAPIFWHTLHHYQKARLMTFLNPERDPLGTGYHIIQSKIAIGSGGFLGKGWLMGTQSHLHFLPEHATDFIFAVCGEEFGLCGSIVLILLYLFITGCCFRITYYAQNTYTRLLAGSLSLMFFLSVFVNIGMVSGILPVVGLPLPLISYGGSSMVTLMATFGILMSIHGHRKLLSK